VIEDLEHADLIIDEVYVGSRNGNASDDPLPRLLGVDNQAGFRHLGPRPKTETLKLIVLKTSLREPDWPDNLDSETGIFTYYGDRREPGELHNTARQGNLILKNLFTAAHDPTFTSHFPPIFVFRNTGVYRDVRFLGLAVPGAKTLSYDDDLVALWRAKGPDNVRFQNYRAKFSILNVPKISRNWIQDVQSGINIDSPHAPKAWSDWVTERKFDVLEAPHTVEIRDKSQQLPESKDEKLILELIYNHYKDDPYGFEYCAMEIARLSLPAIHKWELTRPWRDGGRDAIGAYKIGIGLGAIDVEFALEAKCYKRTAGVGVKELSRLLSRLKHRQFGILVTTSYLARQAYSELKEDGHPVVVIAASDIITILKNRIGSIEHIRRWLQALPE
jgi:hypothetical protein